MKTLELSQMEKLEGGKNTPQEQCQGAMGAIFGMGIGFCCSAALLPVGIVCLAMGSLAFSC